MSTENDFYYCHGCDLGWTEASPTRGWGSDCPRCGTQILSFRQLSESTGEDDGAQTVFTIILAGGGATAAIFLKTIAEESAKDIYALLKKRSWHRGAKDPGGRDIYALLELRGENPDGLPI